MNTYKVRVSLCVYVDWKLEFSGIWRGRESFRKIEKDKEKREKERQRERKRENSDRGERDEKEESESV